MGEGWALYTESLGKELGLYTDPYQYMGALGDEMHRAIRLVVDVGMHTKGMTREQAIQYMMDNEAISERGHGRNRAVHGRPRPGAEPTRWGSSKSRSCATSTSSSSARSSGSSAFHDELLAQRRHAARPGRKSGMDSLGHLAEVGPGE